MTPRVRIKVQLEKEQREFFIHGSTKEVQNTDAMSAYTTPLACKPADATSIPIFVFSLVRLSFRLVSIELVSSPAAWAFAS